MQNRHLSKPTTTWPKELCSMTSASRQRRHWTTVSMAPARSSIGSCPTGCGARPSKHCLRAERASDDEGPTALVWIVLILIGVAVGMIAYKLRPASAITVTLWGHCVYSEELCLPFCNHVYYCGKPSDTRSQSEKNASPTPRSVFPPPASPP